MLADTNRIQVLWALTKGESSVNELAEMVGKPGPSVSQHLAKLRMARLVRARRAAMIHTYPQSDGAGRQDSYNR
jgi:DNA-binding transcriptional ArsR family regulator